MKINVLVITKSSWITTNAFGNTLTNFFGEINSFQITNLYLRAESPQNDVCVGYYNITERQLLRFMFSSQSIGVSFLNSDIPDHLTIKAKKWGKRKLDSIFNFMRIHRLATFLLARELLWMMGRWNNKRLDDFLLGNKVDVIFAAAADPIYLQKIINYSINKTGAKLVLFFADDTYNYKNYYPISLFYQFILRRAIKRSALNASKIYGASQKLCFEYERYFKKKIEPLYKGCKFNEKQFNKDISIPIKIVYAGNLYYERWKTLKFLADELVGLNKLSVKVQLVIYTTSNITNNHSKALNRGESSKIMGALPYEEVKTEFSNSDIVLHVESFAPRQTKITRLSFSTKIIDCIQSGSCMMAIGPRNVASIEYLESIDGPIVVSDIADVGKVLNDIIKNPETIKTKAMSLRKYALLKHEMSVVRRKFEKDIKGLTRYK